MTSSDAPKLASRPLVELGLGCAWMLGLAAALHLVDAILGPGALAAAVLGAVLTDLARGRAHVTWDALAPPGQALAFALRQGLRGAGFGLAAGALAVAASLALGWATGLGNGLHVSLSLVFALVRAVSIAVREEVLFRGIPLEAAARAGVHPFVARAFASLAGAAPLALIPGAGPGAFFVSAALGLLCATLWQRRGASAAVAAHTIWFLAIGSMTHGGLLDLDWLRGDLVVGATASGPPAWAAGIVLVLLALVVERSRRVAALTER